MYGIQNRKAHYKEVLAYCEYGNEPIAFTTYTRGSISEIVSGTMGWNFDRIFILDGDTKTMANYTDEERAKKYSHDNWLSLSDYLGKRNEMEISI